MNYSKFQKYVGQGEIRQKFKKQCLKQKNILFENDQMQIGCKITPLYDFYASENYLQINLFIGNKTDRPLQNFKIDYRGTSNLEFFIEQKNRVIREKTQFKERLIVSCTNYEEQILILLDFQSTVVTLKSIAIPVTLFNFCIFTKGESIPVSIQSVEDLLKLLEHKYQFIEEKECMVNSHLFKKGIYVELPKYFQNIVKVCENVFVGNFTTKNLMSDFTVILFIVSQKVIKMTLCSNQYNLFDAIFNNFKYLLE